MKPNAFLAKQQAKTELAIREARRFTIQQCHDMACIALHLEFGFGPERIARYSDAVLKVWNTYADTALADTDKDMVETHEKIDRVLKEACGDRFVEWEERYK